MQQIPFNFHARIHSSKEDLIKGTHNFEIIDFLFNYFLTNVENIILISGPSKVGKSYLSHLFLKEVNGLELKNNDISSLDKIEELTTKNRIYLFEDIDSLEEQSERQLFHFYNLIKQSNSRLILTSKLSPKQIKFSLPDLHSRIINTRIFYITEPKDDVIKLILFKMFQDKQLKVDMRVIEYILNRVARKSLILYNLVNQIEQEIFAKKQKLTIALIKKMII